MQESGGCRRKVKKRVQAGWNGWRKVSGVICDRRLPARLKGKVYSSVVRPAMVYGLETVAVTKKQVKEMEVAEMKMLRFAMGVTRKDKIRNKYIRNEDEGGQAEMVWTCHKEIPEVHKKKDDGNGVTGKEEKREAKENIFRCYGEVGVKETEVENRTAWRKMIRCGYPRLKKKAESKKED